VAIPFQIVPVISEC